MLHILNTVRKHVGGYTKSFARWVVHIRGARFLWRLKKHHIALIQKTFGGYTYLVDHTIHFSKKDGAIVLQDDPGIELFDITLLHDPHYHALVSRLFDDACRLRHTHGCWLDFLGKEYMRDRSRIHNLGIKKITEDKDVQHHTHKGSAIPPGTIILFDFDMFDRRAALRICKPATWIIVRLQMHIIKRLLARYTTPQSFDT